MNPREIFAAWLEENCGVTIPAKADHTKPFFEFPQWAYSEPRTTTDDGNGDSSHGSLYSDLDSFIFSLADSGAWSLETSGHYPIFLEILKNEDQDSDVLGTLMAEWIGIAIVKNMNELEDPRSQNAFLKTCGQFCHIYFSMVDYSVSTAAAQPWEKLIPSDFFFSFDVFLGFLENLKKFFSKLEKTTIFQKNEPKVPSYSFEWNACSSALQKYTSKYCRFNAYGYSVPEFLKEGDFQILSGEGKLFLKNFLFARMYIDGLEGLSLEAAFAIYGVLPD